MCAPLLTVYILHFNYFIHFSTLDPIPLLSGFIQWDHLNKNTDSVTLKNIVNFYSFCKILMSEHTLAYFSRCFQSETIEKKTLAKTLIRADSRSLLLPIVATFLWLQILTGFLGILSVALLSLQKLQISLTQHIRLIPSHFLSCLCVNITVPGGEWNCLCWI